MANLKQKPYADLGLGPHFIEQPYVSLTNGNGGYQPDAIWGEARVLMEDKRSLSDRTMQTARTEVTAYFAELWRAQKPNREEQWLGVATNRHKICYIRNFVACRPCSPWLQISVGQLAEWAPGRLDVPMSPEDILVWSAGNIHRNDRGKIVRLCTKCGQDKPLSAFYRASNRAGTRAACAQCANAIRKGQK